jgi:hypothetical protein
MKFCGILNKLRKFIKATVKVLTYLVVNGPMMTDGFKVGSGLKQGDRLAPNLLNIA